MKRITRPTGIELEIPSTHDISESPDTSVFRRGYPASAEDVTDGLIEALREHELVLMDVIPVAPTAITDPEPGHRRRSAGAGEPSSLSITVPLAEEDEAVV